MSVDEVGAISRKLDVLLERMIPGDRRFMNVPRSAKYVDLSQKSIRRLLASGKLTALRPVRGRILIDRVELDAFILSSTASQRRGRGMRK